VIFVRCITIRSGNVVGKSQNLSATVVVGLSNQSEIPMTLDLHRWI
jgi:hypothetical protein